MVLWLVDVMMAWAVYVTKQHHTSITFTKKLTYGDKRSRQYFMTKMLAVTTGLLTIRNQCLSVMPWRKPGSQQLCLTSDRQQSIPKPTQLRAREHLRPRIHCRLIDSTAVWPIYLHAPRPLLSTEGDVTVCLALQAIYGGHVCPFSCCIHLLA